MNARTNPRLALVATPVTGGAASPASAGPTVLAMAIGQHVLTIALTAIGVVRALAAGSPAIPVVVAGVAILSWHTVSLLIPQGSRRLTVGWFLGMVGVWIIAVIVSPEFIWMVFPLWLLAGHLLTLGWGLALSTALLAVAVFAPIVHHGTTTYANVFGPLIGGVFAYGVSRGYLRLLTVLADREQLVTSLTRAQQDMAELQDELALTQRESGAIEERTRISRDIHDTVAQSLSSIRLLAHAGVTQDAHSPASRTLEQVERLAGESLADVRRIVAALAPAELEDRALAAALQRMLDRMSDETRIETKLRVDDTLPDLPTDVEIALLRTAQSALANVRLHAGASRVVVSLIDAGDQVRLDIIDDGGGFDAEAWEHDADSARTSYGLRFMRSRLRELGGGIDVESAPGEGTALSVRVPLRGSAPQPRDQKSSATRKQEETT